MSSTAGAPWYNVYQTKDGKWLSVGAIEQRFYAEFVSKLGLDPTRLPAQHDRQGLAGARTRVFAEVIATRTRDEWERVFAGSDACVAPVLSLAEVEHHPHNKARSTFLRRDGVLQPAAAPRFSRSQAEIGIAAAPARRRHRRRAWRLGLQRARRLANCARQAIVGAQAEER